MSGVTSVCAEAGVARKPATSTAGERMNFMQVFPGVERLGRGICANGRRTPTDGR
jgi:hypothetical protein